MRHRGAQPRTLIGLDGPITFSRVRFQCGKTGRMVVPLDEALDLPDGEVTPSLAQRALRLGTKLSFPELQEELLEQHDVRLTDSTLDTLATKVGGIAEADRQSQTKAVAALPRGVAREQKVKERRPAPKVLYVSCDGIMYRTRYREKDPENPKKNRLIYQEMKVGSVFWQDDDERWHKQVLSGRDDPESFGLSLWILAVECGMLNCQQVVFISDGGSWCSTVAETYFKHATRILDWYHLSEYVWDAARALHPGDEDARELWVKASVSHLHDMGGAGLIAHLEQCLATLGDGGAQHMDPLMNYLRPRLAITDYPSYRAKGYIIGSGMMESTCKQVVERRLCGSGMQWGEPGAVAMAALVSKKLNAMWKEFWATRPMHRSATATVK